ncbi:MAG TPA: transposase [Chlamydiales bacterium]|jgi:transposase|nr:transposase [Chlamydiales bacterium]
MSLKQTISQYWEKIQGTLFPILEEVLPPLTQKQQRLISILEVLRIEEFIFPNCPGFRGRPEKSRRAILRAFVAKAVYNMPTTRMLIERLHSDGSFRRICGFELLSEIPSESVFSRAFAEFATTELLIKVHEELIKTHYENEIVGHIITDSSAIEAREKAAKKIKEVVINKPKNPGGRPKKGQEKPKEMTRIEKQAFGAMTLEEMLKDLPHQCDVGAKKNTKGNLEWWIGYKLHITVDDHGIPLAGILSSASLNDNQVAIPLGKLTAQRVTGLYDLMDSAYYVPGIIEHSKNLGHVPIIERPAERGKTEEKQQEKLAWDTLHWKPAEMVRFEKRTTIERSFSRLKEEFGARFVKVRGHAKVFAHLMFGILVLSIDQLLRI